MSMPNNLEAVVARFHSRRAQVAVIGLGYVGLPLAVGFAEAGYRVHGIDVDVNKVDAINRGESYIEDIPSARLAALTGGLGLGIGDRGLGIGAQSQPLAQSPVSSPQSPIFSATTDFSVLAVCDAVSICVPTPLNKTGDPDISYIVAAAEAIGRYLHPGMVVVLESTTYPGTTREVVLPILQKQWGLVIGDWGLGGEAEALSHHANGFAHETSAQSPITNHQSPLPGTHFFLAFSPERIDPGRTDWTVHNTPKVIGGMTEACRTAAMAFYAAAIERLVPVSSPDVAETAKLFENTFRSVNIALANELLLMCDKLGMDAWEVIDAAATKPFGFMKFTPGPGLGGHCIPIDPLYLSWKLRTLEYKARFIELAGEINTDMPRYWVQKVQDALNEVGKAVKGSKVLVLGVAYKKDVSDVRESPALDIIHLLQQRGATVQYHDPHVPVIVYEGIEMTSIPQLDEALAAADCVVIATDHDMFKSIDIRNTAQLLVDTRYMTTQTHKSSLREDTSVDTSSDKKLIS